jgi:hypothetical protein
MTRPTLLALALSAVLAVALPAAAHADRGCGTTRLNDGATVHIRILRGPASCATARDTLRRYLHSHGRCGGSSCYRRIAGWDCQSAGSGAFPRLASCSRGARRVAAYSLAD